MEASTEEDENPKYKSVVRQKKKVGSTVRKFFIHIYIHGNGHGK